MGGGDSALFLYMINNYKINKIAPHLELWWESPRLANRRDRPTSAQANADPEAVLYESHVPNRGHIGKFKPSRKWVYYNKLPSVDVGYIVPLYSIKAIALRYGLGQNSTIYFKKHILPAPLEMVRRRSVTSHHWSRFTLKALDIVMKDLESKGKLNFLKDYHEHIALVSNGSEIMASYYADEYTAEDENPQDKYGVSWVTD